MTVLVFVDNRPRLPREALATINLSAACNDVWLIKPPNRAWDSSLDARVTLVDPSSLGVASILAAFRKRYVHRSTNSIKYERGCFERFILMHGLMETCGFRSAWHFDTDAWAVMNLSSLENALSGYDMVAHIPGSLDDHQPSVSVSQTWLSADTLAKFVQFVANDFFSSRFLGPLEAWYANRLTSGLTGGVSDMTAWGLFLSESRDLNVLNSYVSLVSGFVLVDSLYPTIRGQLKAMGMAPSRHGVRVLPAAGCPVLDVNGHFTPIAGVHFSGADKGLIHEAAKGSVIRVDSTRHKLMRLQYRVRRRLLMV